MKKNIRICFFALLTVLLFTGCKEDDGSATKPTASAGADKAVTTGSLATLDGSGSTADVTFSWSIISQPSKGTARLSYKTVAKPTFTPNVDGRYNFQLIVNDGTSDSDPDLVTITATSGSVGTPPTANAGSDQTVSTGSKVTLDGSGSSNGVTYNWSLPTKPIESSASLTDSTAVNPSFTADLSGTYVVRLIVNDGTSDSSADTATITASSGSPNTAPSANAGTDIEDILSVNPGYTFVLSPVELNGSGSSDDDGDPLTYSWSITSRPAGSSANFVDASLQKPTFTPDKPGRYVASLVVSDGKVNSSSDTINVDVSKVIWKWGGQTSGGHPFSMDESGIIYFGYSNSVRAIKLSDGLQSWSTQTDTLIWNTSYFNGTVYGLCYSSNSSTYLHALDTSGDQKWETQLYTYMDGPITDSSGNAYVLGSSKVSKIDATGDIILNVNGVASSSNNYGPILDASGNIYFGSFAGLWLKSLNPNGTERWVFSTPTGAVSRPAIDDKDTTSDISDDIVYAPSADGKLYAINVSNGLEAWNYPTGDIVRAQPVVGPDGTVYVGSYDNKFYAINPDGSLKWTIDSSGDIMSAAAISADGKVYFASEVDSLSGRSMLYSVDASGDTLWSYQLKGDSIRSGVMIADNCRILVSTDYYLFGVYDECSGPATTRWPTFRKNNARNGQ